MEVEVEVEVGGAHEPGCVPCRRHPGVLNPGKDGGHAEVWTAPVPHCSTGDHGLGHGKGVKCQWGAAGVSVV